MFNIRVPFFRDALNNDMPVLTNVDIQGKKEQHFLKYQVYSLVDECVKIR